MDDHPNAIPPKFWRSLREREWMRVFKTGALDAKLCKKLWRIKRRTDTPPQRLEVLINREDLMREFPDPIQH